ncbi:hypothetical protein KEM54_005938 [Ascosphaera aggregata]|nr:hypothetical protein KEM54_005938 [Ascosphaera aggregata]
MDTALPLTQQARPQQFQPKIIQLYQRLFLSQITDITPTPTAPATAPTPDFEPTEGFWREFFLLPPDFQGLSRIVDRLTPDEVLNIQTLTTFLSHLTTKKFTNPSPDTIAVLAGFDNVDTVFSDFVAVLDNVIRNGRNIEMRMKAVQVAIAIVTGAYKTSLISYFMHRDLFPSLMKLSNEARYTQIFEPFLLLGLLANYNKFEFQNPYQLRLDDFVNEAIIQQIVKGVGITCSTLRNAYLDVQSDAPEGWSIASILGWGKGKEKQLTPEEMREMFALLPNSEAAVLLGVYDFINSNKLFGYSFVTSSPENKKSLEESPFAAYLSLTSYLLHHAYRTERASVYAEINLFALRVMIEDPVLCKQICSDANKRPVRLCRQKAPFLPLVQGDRVLATAVMDVLVDAINHNLRKSTRLTYHYSQLWRTLLNLVRFLTTYSADLLNNPKITTLASSLTDLITFCISAGDTFLPDPASYDDLYYKVVESGQTLQTFKDLYKPTSMKNQIRSEQSIETLMSVANHFNSLLFTPDKHRQQQVQTPPPPLPQTSQQLTKDVTESGATTPRPSSARKKLLSPKEVHEIIKQRYDTLSIQAAEELSTWERWREVDWRSELKRTSRVAVDDAKAWIAKRNVSDDRKGEHGDGKEGLTARDSSK